jgi:hypothetical protein
MAWIQVKKICMPLQQAQNKFKRPFKNLLFKALFFVMGAFLLSAKAQNPPSSANDALLGVPRVGLASIWWTGAV